MYSLRIDTEKGKMYVIQRLTIGYGPAYKRCKIGTPINYNGKAITLINYVWPFNACFNESGHPAMNMPLGLGEEELPVGIQLVGPYWSERDLFHFAKMIAEFTEGFVKPEGILPSI